MTFHWQTEHKNLAAREFAKILKAFEKQNKSTKPLPPVSPDILEFIQKSKPVSEGNLRDLETVPFWTEIYKDDYPFKMIVGGRQIYKSTYVTDILTHEAITRPGAQLGYVTFKMSSLANFSKQKLRSSFVQNPDLMQYLGRTSNINEHPFKNGSVIHCTTSVDGYKNIEGKSLHHVILDEAQYQPMHLAQKVMQTTIATKGKITMCGIGGESGSAYENYWNKSTKSKWFPSEPEWRKKLQFDENGPVFGRYMKDLMHGTYVAQNPENSDFHGYHISQLMIPTNPLTMDDAKNLYKVNPMFSIEYQIKANQDDPSFYTHHVLGQFSTSLAKPVTPEMVLQCMTPFRHLSLLTRWDIADLKRRYGKNIRICMGVDFGSGYSSKTVISIIIKWKISKGVWKYQLVYLEERPAENQVRQAEYISELFYDSKCDVGIGDFGYGANQIKIIQDGWNKNDGTKFPGVKPDKFIGCRTFSDETLTAPVFEKDYDEHGDRVLTAKIDKTWAIQHIIDLLDMQVVEPTQEGEPKPGPKLMIPYAQQKAVGFLVRDFTNITRKDLLESETVVDSRQRAKKEFNHPKDSVMSLIYAIVGAERKRPTTYLASTPDDKIPDEDFEDS